MLDLIPDWLKPIFWGISFACIFAKFGDFWEKSVILGEEFKTSIRKRVRKKLTHASQTDNLASLFLSFFDSLFDPSRTGRPRFWSSVLASCIVLTIIVCAWAFCWPERAKSIPLSDWGHITLFAVGINLIGDIFSLWETRFVIGRMANVRGAYQAIWLLLDIAATVLIYIIGLILASLLMLVSDAIIAAFPTPPIIIEPPAEFPTLSMIIGLPHFVIDVAFDSLIRNQGLFFCDSADKDYFSIFFYTTFFTSVWAWVFMLGIKLWPLFTYLVRNVLNVGSHPVGAVMTIGGVFLGLTIAIVGYVLLIFQSGGCLSIQS